MVIFIISVLVALGVSALCSLLEAAVLSLTPSQVAELSRRSPRIGAIWQGFKERIDRPIAVILVINTAAHTVGATVAGAKFEAQFHKQGLIWFSLLFTYLMLQFTEILPKTLGVHYNRRLAPWIAYPLALLARVLAPVLFLIRLINKPFEGKRRRVHPDPTLEEITALAGLARLANLIGPHQERIIRGASRLSGLDAREVMIPVEQVSFLSTAQSLTEAIEAARQDAHTRFPVCEEGDRNRVLGYVNFKEMIYQERMGGIDQGPWAIIRPVRFVSPDAPATQLLRAFVDQHQHVAVVRSAEGQTLGLVTLEDLIEELVGELEDEFDRLPRLIHWLNRHTCIAGGGVPIRELAANLGMDLRDAQGTTSAWLLRRLDHLPRPGETLTEQGGGFTIRRVRRGKVYEVMVTRPASPGPAHT
jgi:putative hemolysin